MLYEVLGPLNRDRVDVFKRPCNPRLSSSASMEQLPAREQPVILFDELIDRIPLTPLRSLAFQPRSVDDINSFPIRNCRHIARRQCGDPCRELRIIADDAMCVNETVLPVIEEAQAPCQGIL
jgi:hypothetical protein